MSVFTARFTMLPLLLVTAILRAKRIVCPQNAVGFLIKRVLFYTLGVIAMLLFGTMVISGIEGNALLMRNWKYLDQQEGLLDRIEQGLIRKNLSRHINRTALDADVMYKIAELKNVSTVICAIQNEKEWSFHDSLSFTKSVITTIGYGVYYPSTTPSKVVCIVYAMLGVPIFLHFLGYITGGMEYLKDSVVNSKVLKQKDVATMTIIVVAIIVLCAMLINGTMTHVLQQQSDGFDFSNLNERTKAALNSTISIGSEHQWTYFVCVYYVFESITTLGFGDLYVYGAGGAEAIVKDILNLLFVSILIALFAFLFALLQDEIENYTLKKITTKNTPSLAVQKIIEREGEAKRRSRRAVINEPNKRYSLDLKRHRLDEEQEDVSRSIKSDSAEA